MGRPFARIAGCFMIASPIRTATEEVLGLHDPQHPSFGIPKSHAHLLSNGPHRPKQTPSYEDPVEHVATKTALGN